jgi:hypothetical protein
MNVKLSLVLLALAARAMQAAPGISGDYLEVRSCDVYTGPCFANGEMGVCGKEAILVWSVRQGAWNGTKLDGLNVIAVVHTEGTMGDLRYRPRYGKAVLLVDRVAQPKQREALIDLARSLAGGLVKEVTQVQVTPMEVAIGTCGKEGCASVKAGGLVEIATRCLGDKDHLCGNEQTFYPPLTHVEEAHPAFTELASFEGNGLNMTWETVGRRSAFLGHFIR